MPVSVNEIGAVIESLYPPRYACEWDNCGFHVNLGNDVQRVLVCLDVTPEVIEEAKDKGCGLIVAHHPLLFHAIREIDVQSHAGRCLHGLMGAGVSLYCAHTSADNARGGINDRLADLFGLENRRFLQTSCVRKNFKVAVSVPPDGAERIRDALAAAGAGELGNYSRCAFSVTGEGTFLPNGRAVPHIGERGRQAVAAETLIQAIVPEERLQGVLQSVREAHPYEEPAIDAFLLESPKEIPAGTGIAGDLREGCSAEQFVNEVKRKLEIGHVRFRGDAAERLRTVAVCGGAGGDLIDAAKKQGAQLFLTGEVKHSRFAEGGISLVEAGHYDTEKCFCAMVESGLQNALADVEYNVTVQVAERVKRPYDYR